MIYWCTTLLGWLYFKVKQAGAAFFSCQQRLVLVLLAGGNRLEMAAPPAELFLDAIQEVVRSNLDFVPPFGRGSLYLRPMLIGSGPILGLGPAPSFTFVVFAAAVGSYFKARFYLPAHAEGNINPDK